MAFAIVVGVFAVVVFAVVVVVAVVVVAVVVVAVVHFVLIVNRKKAFELLFHFRFKAKLEFYSVATLLYVVVRK